MYPFTGKKIITLGRALIHPNPNTIDLIVALVGKASKHQHFNNWEKWGKNTCMGFTLHVCTYSISVIQ